VQVSPATHTSVKNSNYNSGVKTEKKMFKGVSTKNFESERNKK